MLAESRGREVWDEITSG